MATAEVPDPNLVQSELDGDHFNGFSDASGSKKFCSLSSVISCIVSIVSLVIVSPMV